MNKSINGFWWATLGSVFIIITGSLLHFIYDWAPSFLTAVFGAVNESVWEHLKILFWPSLFFTAAKVLFRPGVKGILAAGAVGVLSGIISITVLFYTYTGIVGRNFFIADILLFCIGSAMSAWVSYFLEERGYDLPRKATAALWVLLAAAFVIFTFYPPAIGLFMQ